VPDKPIPERLLQTFMSNDTMVTSSILRHFGPLEGVYYKGIRLIETEILQEKVLTCSISVMGYSRYHTIL